MKTSWKTTATGLASIAGGVSALAKMWETKNFSQEGVTMALSAIAAGWGLIHAADSSAVKDAVATSDTKDGTPK